MLARGRCDEQTSVAMRMTTATRGNPQVGRTVEECFGKWQNQRVLTKSDEARVLPSCIALLVAADEFESSDSGNAELLRLPKDKPQPFSAPSHCAA